MKIRGISALFVLLLALASAVGRARSLPTDPTEPPQGGAAASQTAIDPAKEADIRRLQEMTGGTAMATQVMTTMADNMRPLLTNMLPPGEYRERFIDLFLEKFRSKGDGRQILQLAIPIYDKYLSREDIQGMIQFYGTPLGQKTLSVMPKLTVELQTEGMKWGERLGQEAVVEILAEHPELKAAMEEAARQSASPR